MKELPIISIVSLIGLVVTHSRLWFWQEDHHPIHRNPDLIQLNSQQIETHSQSLSNQTIPNRNSTTEYKVWQANDIYFVRGRYRHLMSHLVPIVLGGQSSKYNFYGIYFINCKVNPNFDSWIVGQAGKWPSHLDLFIEATSKDCAKEDKLHAAVQLLRSSRPQSVTQLNCHTDQDVESHEYHGIHKAWELGQLHSGSEDVIFYFHSKGITHHNNYSTFERLQKKNARETTSVIQSTSLVEEVFDLFPSVAKVGISYSKGHGWVWYNYWYARGSYIKKTDEPRLKPTDRYYYESWLGISYQGKRSESSMCYSTSHTLNIGEYFDADAWKYRPDIHSIWILRGQWRTSSWGRANFWTINLLMCNFSSCTYFLALVKCCDYIVHLTVKSHTNTFSTPAMSAVIIQPWSLAQLYRVRSDYGFAIYSGIKPFYHWNVSPSPSHNPHHLSDNSCTSV